jgi:Xaa-Pro aminopeptidase
MPDQEAARRQRLAAAMLAAELPAVLVTDLVNVRFLSGFTGSNGALLLLGDERSWLATDSRYDLQARQQCPDINRTITRDLDLVLVRTALGESGPKVGFEDEVMSVHAHAKLVDQTEADFTPIGALVDRQRMVKDVHELSLLQQACEATDRALEQVLPHIRVGVTERQVARWLDDALRDLTDAQPGFETIVAAGANSAVPHHTPTDKPISAGDFLKMDFGGQVGGYHADMTRTVVVGADPEAWQREIYEAVANAQAAGRGALEPDVLAADVDRAARAVIEAAGYGEQFGHGLGHGVGLRIHEAPFLGQTSTDRLEPAVPVTVEPGIYLAGRGGVRIEDTVVVHSDRVEILTTTTRELLVLD